MVSLLPFSVWTGSPQRWTGWPMGWLGRSSCYLSLLRSGTARTADTSNPHRRRWSRYPVLKKKMVYSSMSTWQKKIQNKTLFHDIHQTELWKDKHTSTRRQHFDVCVHSLRDCTLQVIIVKYSVRAQYTWNEVHAGLARHQIWSLARPACTSFNGFRLHNGICVRVYCYHTVCCHQEFKIGEGFLYTNKPTCRLWRPRKCTLMAVVVFW